jgi:hypothetical protein
VITEPAPHAIRQSFSSRRPDLKRKPAIMKMDSKIFADPRQHPDNANLPNVNRPETIIGVTVTFLVRQFLADMD